MSTPIQSRGSRHPGGVARPAAGGCAGGGLDV